MNCVTETPLTVLMTHAPRVSDAASSLMARCPGLRARDARLHAHPRTPTHTDWTAAPATHQRRVSKADAAYCRGVTSHCTTASPVCTGADLGAPDPEQNHPIILRLRCNFLSVLQSNFSNLKGVGPHANQTLQTHGSRRHFCCHATLPHALQYWL